MELKDKTIKDLDESLLELKKQIGELAYDVGCLQGDAARRKRITHDLLGLALGVYIGVVLCMVLNRIR